MTAVVGGTTLGSALGGSVGGVVGAAMGGGAGGGMPDLGQMLGVKNGYQASMAPGTVEQLTGAQDTYNQNIAGQQALLQALQAQANGTGPNPAQAMLNQATNKNIQQNAGMIASQKGINPGLGIRLAGQNAAMMSQQAAGQGATMQAQQQVNAQNQMGNVYSNIGSQALNQQNIAQQGFYAPQDINAGVAAGNAKTNAGLYGGLLNSGGAAAAALMAHGGIVPKDKYADGGVIGSPALDPVSNAAAFFNQQLNAPVQMANPTPFKKKSSDAADNQIVAGGPLDAGSPSVGTMVASEGGKVPGKANVKGDSYSNDVVDAKLSPGEIVIPRSITMGESPGENAKKFVEEQLAKHQGGKKKFAEGGEVSDDKPWYMKPGGLPDVPDEGYLGQASKEDADERKNYRVAQTPAPLAQEDDSGTSLADISAPSTQDVPQSMPEANQVAPQTGLDTQPQSAAPQPAPDTFGNQAYAGAMGQGLAEQKLGLQQEAQAMGQQGAQEAQAIKLGNQNIQQINADYQKNYQALNEERQKLLQDVQAGHVDPNHYWAEKSMPGKISTVVGILLSGIGSGLTGQDNLALKYLNSQIDRDINSQKMNLENKKSLLSYNMQQLGNLRDATMMTKAMQMDMISNQLKMAAAQAQSPIAKAKALQAAGVIDEKAAPMLQQLAMRRSILGGAHQGKADPALVIRAYVPENQQKDYYKELKDMQNTTRTRDNILGAFDQVNKINTLGNRAINPIQSKRQVEAIVGPLTAGLSKETAGRFTEQDAGMLTPLWPTPGDSPETVARKRAQIEKLVGEKMNFPMLEPLGITPDSMSRYQSGGGKRIQLGAPKI